MVSVDLGNEARAAPRGNSPFWQDLDWSNLAQQLARLVVTAAFLAVAIRPLANTVNWVDYPFVLDYGEGVVVSQVQRLEAGEPLYPASDVAGEGFVGANYPPLYYLLLDLLPDDADNPFGVGRLVSLAGFGVTALMAGIITWRSTRRLLAGTATAALFLAMPPAQEWALFVKPDLLAVALSTTGLAVAVCQPRRPWLAAPWLALGLLTKQTVIMAPLVLVLVLGLSPGRRRAGLITAAAVAAIVLAPLTLLELTPDAVFWHLLLANSRGWFWGRFDDIGLKFLEISLPLVLVLPLAALAAWRRRRLDVATVYAPLTLLTLLAAGAPGSSRNYAIEAALGLAIGAGLVLGHLPHLVPRWRPLLAGALAALLVVQASELWRLPVQEYGRRMPSALATERKEAVREFVANLPPGPALSEDPGLLVLAGREVDYHDPSLMAALDGRGLWNESTLLQQIQNRDFVVILTEVDLNLQPDRPGRWSPRVVAAIRANYHLLYRDILSIWLPRERAARRPWPEQLQWRRDSASCRPVLRQAPTDGQCR